MQVDSEKILGAISKNRDEELRVSEVVIEGRDYISVSVFWKEGGKFRRGITVTPAVLAEVVPLLVQALADARHESR